MHAFKKIAKANLRVFFEGYSHYTLSFDLDGGINMVCYICGKDVAGLPVMRDNRTGLECCEACSVKIGGAGEFIKYIDSRRGPGAVAPDVQKMEKDAEELEGVFMADKNFKFCTACGRKVALNAQFCAGCGAALGAKVAGITKTLDFSELEGAYLVRQDLELEKRVSDSLDAIAAQGERGTKALVERLYKDMTLKGNTLVVKNYGDYSRGTSG
jgi:zinc-ribbon domain